MTQSKKIGFIGLGMIGMPMAKNILKNDYDMNVYDLRTSTVDELVKLGARAFGSAAEVAAESNIVITMVPDAPDVEKAALGSGGIIEGIRSGALYMDMSTIDPGTTRKVGAAMKEKGVRMVDAPVARTVDEAIAGKLAIMIGGDPNDVEEVMPILKCMGDTFTYCGPLGNGVALKLTNNYISAGIIALHAEALAFGVRAGLNLEDIIELVSSTFAGSRMLSELFPKKAFKGDFSPGFFSRLSRKDQRLGLTLAKEMGVDTPVGRGVFETLEKTCAAGYETDDLSSMIRVREDEAGIKVRLK